MACVAASPLETCIFSCDAWLLAGALRRRLASTLPNIATKGQTKNAVFAAVVLQLRGRYDAALAEGMPARLRA